MLSTKYGNEREREHNVKVKKGKLKLEISVFDISKFIWQDNLTTRKYKVADWNTPYYKKTYEFVRILKKRERENMGKNKILKPKKNSFGPLKITRATKTLLQKFVSTKGGIYPCLSSTTYFKISK